MEYIRPIVEERSAEMEGFGEDWDDAPVCLPVFLDSIMMIFLFYSYNGNTERHADVADERSPRSRKITRRLGPAIAHALCGGLYDFYCKLQRESFMFRQFHHFLITHHAGSHTNAIPPFSPSGIY
jgi:hypothetical protein